MLMACFVIMQRSTMVGGVRYEIIAKLKKKSGINRLNNWEVLIWIEELRFMVISQ